MPVLSHTNATSAQAASRWFAVFRTDSSELLPLHAMIVGVVDMVVAVAMTVVAAVFKDEDISFVT